MKRLVAALALGLLATGPGAAQQRSSPPRTATSASDVDSGALAALTRDIRAGGFGNVHALLVQHRGRRVYEEYFSGPDERRGEPLGTVRFDRNMLHDARSVTKSVVSVLFGLAVRDGHIQDLDTPVLDYFPGLAELRTPERMAIRLRHLLAMTSGLAWDESSRPYGDPANDETRMDRAADPYRFVLERPRAAAPGERWEYSGGDTMLLAGVIERATGMSIEAYAERVLFRPLGIRSQWLRYPNGLPIAASGLRLRPRDMLSLGQLYLDGGRWRGAQLVPESWVRDSLAPQARISDRPIGLQQYGYQWYLGTARVRDRAVPYHAAIGWGGQRILIVPSMHLVAVLNAGLYGDRRQSDIAFEILLDRVLPAIRTAPAG